MALECMLITPSNSRLSCLWFWLYRSDYSARYKLVLYLYFLYLLSFCHRSAIITEGNSSSETAGMDVCG